MDNNGKVNYQIKHKKLQKRYLAALKKSGMSESEFNRISIRNTITCIETTNTLPKTILN